MSDVENEINKDIEEEETVEPRNSSEPVSKTLRLNQNEDISRSNNQKSISLESDSEDKDNKKLVLSETGDVSVAEKGIEDSDLDEVNDNIDDSIKSADDNLSLEVNFGDGGSCRASDVSSISFQNIVLDDPNFDFDYALGCGSHLRDHCSVKDSVSESSDSPLHDFPSDEIQPIDMGKFAEEIKLRESSRVLKTKQKFCTSGEGCGTDEDELACDSRQVSDDLVSFDQYFSTNTAINRKVNVDEVLNGSSSTAKPENALYSMINLPSSAADTASQLHFPSNTSSSPVAFASKHAFHPSGGGYVNGGGENCSFTNNTNISASLLATTTNTKKLCTNDHDNSVNSHNIFRLNSSFFQGKHGDLPLQKDGDTKQQQHSVRNTVSTEDHIDDSTVCSSDQYSVSSSTDNTTVSGRPGSEESDCDTTISSGSLSRKSKELETTVRYNSSSKTVSSKRDHCSDSSNSSSHLAPTSRKDENVSRPFRRSPGLARRMPEDRDSSSSEKELDTTQIDTTVRSGPKSSENYHRKSGKPSHNVSVEKKLKESIIENLRALSPEKQMPTSSIPDNAYVHFENVMNNITSQSQMLKEQQQVISGEPNGKDVKNEYDYVKYARIQHGDSYVGMRLAFSTSEEAVKHGLPDNAKALLQDDHYPSSSREGSPNKVQQLQQKRRELIEPMKVSKVSEETLTEISLNGSDPLMNEEHKNFSLSPEMTECDSAEVESVLSEEGKSAASGMPNVDDGLSSSQGSDNEDIATSYDSKVLPSELLKRRQKLDIAQEIEELQQKLNETEVREFFMPLDKGGSSSTTECSPAHQELIKKKDALDLAIQVCCM